MSTASIEPEASAASWYLSPVEPGRLRLFQRGIVALFAFAMLLVGWLALPDRTLSQRLAGAQRSDLLTASYLRAWVAADPADWSMRLAAARHELLLGNNARAIALLDTIIAHGPANFEHRSLVLRLAALESMLWALPASSSRRALVAVDIQAALDRLAHHAADPGDIDALLTSALAHGHRRLARSLLQRLVSATSSTGPARSPRNTLEMAKIAAQLGDYRLASKMYWNAYDASSDRVERRRLLALLIRTGRAGDRVAELLDELAPRLATLAADDALSQQLARLALAVNRLELAEHFVRHLLRLGPGRIDADMLRRALSALEFMLPIRSAHASTHYRSGIEDRARRTEMVPGVGFDPGTFDLGFQVMMANRKLDEAFEIARKAVAANPKDIAWRIRLAQSSEWSQRPQLALAQWQIIARASKRVDHWGNVERLATALRAEPTLLEALRWRHKHSPPRASAALTDLSLRISNGYERQGKPEQAIAWLRRQMGRHHDEHGERLGEALIAVLERAGKPEAMLESLLAANARYGVSIHRSVRASRIELNRGNLQHAFEILHRLRALVESPGFFPAGQATEHRYWNIYAELARLLGRPADALDAYAAMLASGEYESFELVTMASIVESRSLPLAASLMRHAHRRLDDPAMALRAAIYSLRAGNIASAERSLQGLAPEARRRAEDDPNYLRASAAALHAAGRNREAADRYRRLLAREPGDADAIAGMVWLLIGQRDARSLKRLLHARRSDFAKRQALWGAAGAAYLAIGEAHKALPFFVKQARHSQDYLWWLAYADALEAVEMRDAAWSLRRKAWSKLPQALMQRGSDVEPATRSRIVSLAMQFAPADRARAMLGELLRDSKVRRSGAPDDNTEATEFAFDRESDPLALARQIRALPRTQASRPPELTQGDPSAARELALSYMISREPVPMARAWLLSRYADDLSRPAWAKLSVALASNDREELGRLLDTMPDWLPRLDRIEAMRRTGRIAGAQTLAFDTLSTHPESDAAHERFADLVSESSGAVLSTRSEQSRSLSTTRQRAYVEKRIGQHTTATVDASLVRTSTRDRSLAPTRQREQALLAGVRWRGQGKTLFAALGARHVGISPTPAGRSTHGSARIGARLDAAPGRTLEAVVGIGERADETAALQIGGARDRLMAGWREQVTSRSSLRAEAGVSRLHSLAGTTTAHGFVTRLEGDLRLRIDYPDISLKASIAHGHYRGRNGRDALIDQLAGPASAGTNSHFVPDSSTEMEVGVGYGETALVESTRRALRPYARFGVTLNSVSGAGASLRAGLATAIAGADQLRIEIASIRSGTDRSDRTNSIQVQYLWHF